MTEYTQLYFFQWTLVLRSLLLPLEIELVYWNAGAETWSAVETWSVSQDLQPTRTEWDANCSRTIFFLTTGNWNKMHCQKGNEKNTSHHKEWPRQVKVPAASTSYIDTCGSPRRCKMWTILSFTKSRNANIKPLRPWAQAIGFAYTEPLQSMFQ